MESLSARRNAANEEMKRKAKEDPKALEALRGDLRAVSQEIKEKEARLKEVELELDEDQTDERLQELLKRLDQIEHSVNRINTPLAYTDNLYLFKQNVDLVRARVRWRLKP